MIGVDIVEIKRIERAMEMSQFLTRICTDEEREFLRTKNFAPQTVAGIYAAKEAVSKAIGTGLGEGVGFHDIEVSHDQLGRPTVIFHGIAKSKVEEQGGGRAVLSISHEKDYAVAMCLIHRV